MAKTNLLYLKDSYQQDCTAKIASIKKIGKQIEIILNQTIFYPQGGGQPSDKGNISVNSSDKAVITSVSLKDNLVIHTGNLTGNIKQSQAVTCQLNWPLRYKHMQYHTAGHILDEAVKELNPEFHGIKGQHGIGHKYFLTFNGFIDKSKQSSYQKAIDTIIANQEPIITRLVTKKQIQDEGIHIPFKLPTNKPLRLITIGDRPPVPDGGTLLISTGESWPINLTNFTYQNGQTTINYQVDSPKSITTSKKDTIKTPPINKTITRLPSKTTINKAFSLKSFSTQIDKVFEKFDQLDKTEETKTKFLGKSGHINQLSRSIPLLRLVDRSQAGRLLNQLKSDINQEVSASLSSIKKSTSWVDVTRPGKQLPIGHLHPISQAINEIQHIFETIGFTRVRYPEVDWDYYVFESLNMPPDHPARDEWETFFVDTHPHPQKGQMVLTTHTSNGQVREMKRVKNPPIRMLNIAKCYRRQQDVTHTAMFHQFEGLVIDKGINIQNLKGTLDYFAKKYYGPKAKSRIRPFMFKFTEPSFEVDFSCVHCQGKGCRFCKSGWHEVGGAGMVHPNVLKFGGIDPKKYTGFAFGWGIERVYTLKPGLHLDDIRPLYSKNLEFLQQF